MVLLSMVAFYSDRYHDRYKERLHRNRGFSSKPALGGREPSRDYDDPSKLSTPPNQKPNKG